MIAEWHNGEEIQVWKPKPAWQNHTSDAIPKLPFFNPIKSDPWKLPLSSHLKESNGDMLQDGETTATWSVAKQCQTHSAGGMNEQ